MRHCVLAVAILAAVAGCASTIPPERLATVTAELSEVEARELAETQPTHLREAGDHRDAAWEELDRGHEDLAEVHSWVSWLKLRTAENLEAISRSQALAGVAEASPAVAQDSEMIAEPVTSPEESPAGEGERTASEEEDAAQAVRDAEDAQLRLLSTGLPPDRRWAEADALLRAAMRALDRGENARAEELGDRAALVYEVIRLTGIGDRAPIPPADGLYAQELLGTAPATAGEPDVLPGEYLPMAEAPAVSASPLLPAEPVEPLAEPLPAEPVEPAAEPLAADEVPSESVSAVSGSEPAEVPDQRLTTTDVPTVSATTSPALTSTSPPGTSGSMLQPTGVDSSPQIVTMPTPVIVSGPAPTVIVVPGEEPEQAAEEPETEEEPAERPRSRIISYILQPIED